jgi:hypothetical protein
MACLRYAWLGHADASFTMSTYVDASPEDLAVAQDTFSRASTHAINPLVKTTCMPGRPMQGKVPGLPGDR